MNSLSDIGYHFDRLPISFDKVKEDLQLWSIYFMFDADIVGDNIITFFYHVFVKICKVNFENINTLCS